MGYPMLSILAKFSVDNKREIVLALPNGESISDEIKYNFQMLISLCPNDSNITCKLILCERENHNNILGNALKMTGTLKKLLSLIGLNLYHPSLGKNPSIQECLNVMSNDYSIFEKVFNSLGINDLATDIAPTLSKYPSLSIIIPGYGIHNTINNVIFSIKKSIEELHYSDLQWECIIVDDCTVVSLYLQRKM